MHYLDWTEREMVWIIWRQKVHLEWETFYLFILDKVSATTTQLTKTPGFTSSTAHCNNIVNYFDKNSRGGLPDSTRLLLVFSALFSLIKRLINAFAMWLKCQLHFFSFATKYWKLFLLWIHFAKHRKGEKWIFKLFHGPEK